MTPSRFLPLSALALVLWVGPALAEDQIIDVKPCNVFCKIWRNLSRNAGVSMSDAGPARGAPDEPVPRATDGVGPVRSSQVAAVPGSVMVLSAAEKARIKRDKAKLDQEVTAKIDAHGHPVNPN